MKRLQTFLSLLTILVLGSASISLTAQTGQATSKAASIVVSIGIDKNQVTVDQSPLAILWVENRTDHEIAIYARMVRIHVEGEKGERPMKLPQRSITGKLLPGDEPLRTDEMALWTISPGDESSHKYQVSYFYDISVPGKYTVYFDVADPSTSGKWLRTKTVQFEVQAPPQ